MRRISFLALCCLILLLHCLLFAQDKDLQVFQHWLRYTDAPNALYHHFYNQAAKYLDQRSQEIAQLQSKREWEERQERARQMLMEIVGPFPEKTPLNAKVLAAIQKDGYRFEKIIYESRPRFYVTAAMFIPDDLQRKAPAIIYCSGHSDVAFRSEAYQRVCINLVKKGFIVLAFDPVGQGERLEYYDPLTQESRVGGPTLEHSYPGAQCFISGSSQARHMIWDGIRTVDYLLTRKEVDPKRIGITGRSGGGTQSAYVAAFDQRILAAAPECFITSLNRLYESKGPQDAEQNFYHGVASGFDHADLLEVRAPKPALMITTTRDFFSIQGARETAAEVERAYAAFGKENNFAMVEDDAPHMSTPKNREAMYAFFQKHLNQPGDPSDQDVEFLTPEELRITETGQVLTSFGGETVFSLNKTESERLLKNLQTSRQDLKLHLTLVKKAARRLSGFRLPHTMSNAVFTGRHQRDGYSVEKYFVKGEGDYKIPFILMQPNVRAKHAIILYLHPNGKSAEAGVGQEMEWFVKRGYIVVAPDLLGAGELGPGKFTGDAYNFKLGKISFNIWFAQILLGRSIVGIHAGDILRILDYIKTREDINRSQIIALAHGTLTSTLMHAAAFDTTISKIVLVEPLISYRAMVINRYYKPQLIPSTVAGALTAYDLPDLAASLAPRDLLMINVVDHNGKRADTDLIETELGVVRKAYTELNSEDKLKICNWEVFQSIDDVFQDWLD